MGWRYQERGVREKAETRLVRVRRPKTVWCWGNMLGVLRL
jgi:hypothetical protein